jgi:hypothetical protein
VRKEIPQRRLTQRERTIGSQTLSVDISTYRQRACTTRGWEEPGGSFLSDHHDAAERFGIDIALPRPVATHIPGSRGKWLRTSSEPGSTLMSSQGTGLRTRRVVILSRSSPKSEREDDARE